MKEKFFTRIALLLFLWQMSNTLNACAYVINKTVIQPTCGSNGLLSFSLTPAPTAGANYKIYRDGSFLVSINGSIANLNSLMPGSYKVVVTENSSGCQDSLVDIVLDPPANALSAAPYIDSPRCDTSTNGRLALRIKNAVSPITYQWRKDGNPFTNNDSVVNPAMKGNYSVTVTDFVNCRVEINNIVVNELQGKMVAIDSIILPTSCDSPNGRIEIIISARHFDPNVWNKNIRYTWQNRPDRDTFNFIDSLPAGKYTVVITDSLNCYPLEIKDLEIVQNPPPKAYILGTDTLCPNIGFGKLEVFISVGDSLNMNYKWNQGQTGKKVEGSEIIAGDYECIVEDRAGCQDTARWTIYPYPEKEIAIVPEFKEVMKLTPQLLRINDPVGLYNIVWSSSPEKKYDVLANRDSVIRSNFVTENTTYFVVAKYGPNCETKANITIQVVDKNDIILDEEVPNIFTPGGGNLTNNYYKLVDPFGARFGSTPLFSSFEIKIYDRWGNLVFTDSKPNFKWDGNDANGKPLNTGVYTYYMKYSSIAKPFDFIIREGNILLER